MLSPTMTVIVLVVLWAIVVVPMIVRRNDARRRERSVAAFGRGMRALGRRAERSAQGFLWADVAPYLPIGNREWKATVDQHESRDQRGVLRREHNGHEATH